MKGKVTSLLLVGSAFIVGMLTQDGPFNMIADSRVLTAFVTIAWFGIVGAGLYFWATQTRQRDPQHDVMAADESSSLRQLAQAIGPSKPISVTESAAKTKETAPHGEGQKNLP